MPPSNDQSLPTDTFGNSELPPSEVAANARNRLRNLERQIDQLEGEEIAEGVDRSDAKTGLEGRADKLRKRIAKAETLNAQNPSA